MNIPVITSIANLALRHIKDGLPVEDSLQFVFSQYKSFSPAMQERVEQFVNIRIEKMEQNGEI